jgi:putative membrane protein
MRILILIFYAVLLLLGVSFAALNASSVQVNFYVKTLFMPIPILMSIMFGLGFFMGFVFFIGRYWRLKIECRTIKNQLRLTEKEIKNLRSIPLQNQH